MLHFLKQWGWQNWSKWMTHVRLVLLHIKKHTHKNKRGGCAHESSKYCTRNTTHMEGVCFMAQSGGFSSPQTYQGTHTHSWVNKRYKNCIYMLWVHRGLLFSFFLSLWSHTFYTHSELKGHMPRGTRHSLRRDWSARVYFYGNVSV